MTKVDTLQLKQVESTVILIRKHLATVARTKLSTSRNLKVDRNLRWEAICLDWCDISQHLISGG